MSAIKTVFREIWGLFVDDGTFAAAILIWLVLCAVALPRLAAHIPVQASGLILFAGLGIILFEDTLRFARNKRR